MNRPAIAYVAEGKLYSQDSTGEPRLVESTFVQGILDRLGRDRDRYDWKSGNPAWQLGARGINPLGMSGAVTEMRRVSFVGLSAGPSKNDVFYTIDTDHTCGLFHHELAEGHERRIYHRNQFRATDLDRCSETGMLAFTLPRDDGTAHLATMAAEGRGVRDITEGDAVDEAPTWVPGQPNVILFQSAGIARNQAGAFTGLSPYAIQKIDLEHNKMEMVIEEDDHDALLPRQAADGSLYFIRRPYEPVTNRVSPWRLLLDILLFPIGVITAIAAFLNVFSLIFTKKPLITAGGPDRDGPDQRLLVLYGRVIDARKILNASKQGKSPALVPASWMLVRRKPNGSESILARSVLAYDLCRDGGVVHTNGSKIFHLTPTGESTEIGHGKLIQRVAALGTSDASSNPTVV